MSWVWGCVEDDKVFIVKKVVIGHGADDVKVNGNWNLYSGERSNIIFFNKNYLFLNYIKKSSFYKKLAKCAGLNYYFVTTRGEFLPLLSKFAEEVGGRVILYKKRGDLFRELSIGRAYGAIKKTKMTYEEPLVFLFNNDSSYSVDLMREINEGAYLTIGVSDSNAIYGNTSVVGLYGNDDSISSLSFIFGFLMKCFSGVTLKKHQPIKMASAKRRPNSTHAFILRQIERKNGKANKQ